ncbi:MAG: hypothetical protein ACXABY_21520, partial [Candidatus Thorarchaeota archaeon]
MQEFSIELKPRIVAGLRRDFRSGRDQVGLVSLFNAKPTEWGLRQFEPPTIPTALQTAMTNASITVSHPFPQLFRGKSGTYLLTQTKLYTVASDWSITEVVTYNPITDAVVGSLTSGSSWHFADFKDSYVFWNGACTVFKWKLEGMTGATDRTFVFTTPFINTGVDFAGRLVFGGFSDGVWRDEWLGFWENLIPPDLLNLTFTIADNSVMWTSVAGSELWWLARPDLVL